MRKALTCVLMTALLLTGCGGGGETPPEELAQQIREEYAALEGWSGTAEVIADYGNTVYEFTLDIVWKREGETVLTVTAPELIAGITARVGPEGGFLEYDGASLSTGALAGDGLSPLEGIPFLMGELLEGYMAVCAYVQEGETSLLKLVCRNPNEPEGSGVECAMYFTTDSHDFVRGEVSEDGILVLTIGMRNFTKEADEHDDGDSEDLG